MMSLTNTQHINCQYCEQFQALFKKETELLGLGEKNSNWGNDQWHRIVSGWRNLQQTKVFLTEMAT